MLLETLLEDVSLWKKCVAGDKEAWDSLVKRYSKLVYKTTWNKLKQYQAPKDINVSDVDNIYQDVFMKILQKLHRWEKRSSLATWIVAISVHATIDHHRKQKDNLLVSLDDQRFQGKQSYDEERSLDDEQNPIGELSFFDEQNPYEEQRFHDEHNPDEEKSFQEAKTFDPGDKIFIRNLLKSLNPTELTVIRLHFLEEWSLEEIAEFLNKKVGAIYTIKSRALDNLREICRASGLM